MYCAGSPVLVESLKSHIVEQVSCGLDFTTAICRRNMPDCSSNGVSVPKSEVYAWGSNSNGQLGSSDCIQTSLPIRIDAFDVLEEEIV